MQYMLRPLCSILVIAAAAFALEAGFSTEGMHTLADCWLDLPLKVVGFACWAAQEHRHCCLVQRSQLQHKAGQICAGSGCLRVSSLAHVLSLGTAFNMRCWLVQCHQLQPGQIICMWHSLPAQGPCSSSACGMR